MSLIAAVSKSNELLELQLEEHWRQSREIEALSARVRELESESRKAFKAMDAVRQSTVRPILDDAARYLQKHQLSLEQTLVWLADGGGSLARFREREFRFTLDPLETLNVPPICRGIQRDLRMVLSQPADGLMVGIPQFNRDIYWSRIWSEYWGRLQPLLSLQGRHANLHITRPVLFQFLGDRGVELWREVWNHRSVVLVTGSKNMSDPAADLFDSAQSITRVSCRNRNAYQDLPGTAQKVLSDVPDIVLVSLGEAAPVLVRELVAAGVRAIDIGSLDASFKDVYSA